MRLPNTEKLIERAREGDFAAMSIVCRREAPKSIPALARIIYPEGGLDAAKFEELCQCFELYEDRRARLARSL